MVRTHRATILTQDPRDDARTDQTRPARQRHRAEHRVEQRGLARAVLPRQRYPFGPGNVQGDRTETKGGALDGGLLQSRHDVARTVHLVDSKAKVPPLEGLVHRLQPLQCSLTLSSLRGQLLGPIDAKVSLRGV